MKINQRTIQILKNFSTINNNLVVKEGSILTTCNGTQSIAALAKTECEFERMAIYDLSKFLQVLTLFQEPELEFSDKFVTIKDSTQAINYTFADSMHLKVPPPGILNIASKFPKTKIDFDISSEIMDKMMKALSVLRLPDLSFNGDGETITLNGFNPKDSTENTYQIVLGETTETFKAVFNKDNIKIIPGNYNIKITNQGIASFSTDDINYYIAVETNKSSF